MDPCCPEAQQFEADADLCEQLACDPTLEACCQRDLEQQALVSRLKARLSIHDRSKERLRVAAQVLGTPPQAAAGQDSQGEEEEDGDDELMGRLRAQRLQELQRAAERRASLQQAGHGSLADVVEARLLRMAESSACPVVCHLAFEGSQLDDELDEHLSRLAHRFLGTRFVRTPVNLRSTLHLRLRTPAGPGLLCFRGGSLVGAASLDRFGAPECILEETVDKWLRQHKVLQLADSGGEPGAAAVAGGLLGQASSRAGHGHDSDDGGSGSSSEAEEGDDWQQPCEVCGRRYPHQHIRSVYATRGSGSDSDD